MSLLLFVCLAEIRTGKQINHCGTSFAIIAGDPIPRCPACANRLFPVVPMEPSAK